MVVDYTPMPLQGETFMHRAEGADLTNMETPVGTAGGVMSIRAVDPREIEVVIATRSGLICIPMKSVSWDITEEQKIARGTGSGLGYAAVGGNIDISGSMEIESFIETGGALNEISVDWLRKLLRKGPEGRAIYFRIDIYVVDYDSNNPDGYASAEDLARYRIISLEMCKLKTNGYSVANGSMVSTKYDFVCLRYLPVEQSG